MAINEPLSEATPEISADEPPTAPRVRDLSRDKTLAPLALKADSEAGDKEVAAADPAPVAGDPTPVAADAADIAVPDDSGTAAPGGVVEEVAGANESRRQKPGNSIEVSRESIDGRLVAVRYEVTIPHSRFGELEAWRRKQTAARPAAVAAPTAAEGASLLKSRARKASPPAGKSKDKSAEQDAGQPTGEFLTLLVDAGKLEALRSELAALQEAFPVRDRILRQGNNVRAKRQGPAAKRSVKGLEKADFAAADAARGAEAKSAPAPEAAPPPGVPEKSRELARRAAPAKAKKAAPRESRAELKKDLRADSKLQVKLGSRAPGAAGKAAPGEQLKVRVEIRFRIVAD